MSGLPTANDIIADLKRRYYCQEENAEISLQDMHNEAVQARIQSYMDARGFPALWSVEEYSGYFDKIFGADKERQRNYLKAILSEDRVRLTVGNRVMAAMLASGHMRALFTTNFDGVVERAFAEVSGRALTTYHLEGSVAALQALNNEGYPLYVKLHGDFRYDSIKNLTTDLLSQDQQLARCMVAAAARFGLIVAGYSGRDESVMALLNQALEQPNAFAAGLFWTAIRGARILPAVADLIAEAQARAIRVGIVEIETFDTLMLRLWRNIENKPAEYDQKVRRSVSAVVNIPVPAAGTARPLLRLNALPIRQLPRQTLRVETSRPVEWPELRDLQRKASRQAVLTKGAQILAWGDADEIGELFGDMLVALAPVDLPDPAGPDALYVQGFLEEALACALARGRPLIARHHRQGGFLIADRNAPDQSALGPVKAKVGALAGPVPDLMTPATDAHPKREPLFWAEALRVSVTRKSGQWWLLVDPDIWIWPPRGRQLAIDFLEYRKRERFNNLYNDLLSAWIEVLFGKRDGPVTLSFSLSAGGNAASNPTFSVGSQTGFSRRLMA
jgi:SIR2-like domain